jgi:hypothetical protein
MLALETTARSAVPAVSPRECTNYALLFTPGERKALAKSKVHQYNQLHSSLQLARTLAELVLFDAELI